jgi:hypothetical protein
MALATPSLRSATAATRSAEHTHVAETVPLKHRADAPAVDGREGTRRERVRMELLIARAATRRHPATR